MLNIELLRQDFPILASQVYGRPLVYLDNAATTQKPKAVVEAITRQYYSANANVHRGVHHLSEVATDLLEESREKVRAFIGARSTSEVIFTRGTTESLNLVASSLCSTFHEGDEVIVTAMEHHSNIVPWQLQCERRGLRLKVLPMTDEGELLLDRLDSLITDRTRLISVAHVSNVLGTVNPVADIISRAHSAGVPVAVDAAQSVPHFPVDVTELDCDFLAFSGHKVYGPTGIGVLYGKEKWLEKMPPYQGGGEMISSVSFEHTEYERLPYKFEAGTPDYIGSTALAEALRYVDRLGMEQIAAYETELLRYATEGLRTIAGARIFGEAAQKGAVLSFLIGDIHHYDMGMLLDRLGIAVRTGHHCAQPLMQALGIEGTVRASFSFYNTKEEIDTFIAAVDRVRKMFSL